MMNFGYIGGLVAAWTATNSHNNKPIRMSQKQALFLVIWCSFLLGVTIGCGIVFFFN
jgi:hypothetical protein